MIEKEEFVKSLDGFKRTITSITRQVNAVSGKQVQSNNLRAQIQGLSTNWFELYDPTLRGLYHLDNDTLEKYRDFFGRLLELVEGRPSKDIVLGVFDSILSKFPSEILVPVRKYVGSGKHYARLNILLEDLTGIEYTYLKEAIDCANSDFKRAAIILGWCAAIDRIHSYIEKEGFDKFNHASVQMATITTGRYKRFNKKFNIHNTSELRMAVFDNDLLWVLEFMGAIDGNEHEKLEICFTMRNTCAHPGRAVITDQNLESFFSDLEVLVFKNPKFTKATE